MIHFKYGLINIPHSYRVHKLAHSQHSKGMGLGLKQNRFQPEYLLQILYGNRQTFLQQFPVRDCQKCQQTDNAYHCPITQGTLQPSMRK